MSSVIDCLKAASTPREFSIAERKARALNPHDQLLVVDTYRAARARIIGGRL